MTTTDDLALRLAAHPRWRWMAGMLVDLYGLGKERHLARITSVEPDYSTDPPGPDVPIAWGTDGRLRGPMTAGGDWRHDAWDHPDAVPDLTDPATQGCLLAMLAEADPTHPWVYGDGHALAEALLACWGSAQEAAETLWVPISEVNCELGSNNWASVDPAKAFPALLWGFTPGFKAPALEGGTVHRVYPAFDLGDLYQGKRITGIGTEVRGGRCGWLLALEATHGDD